MTGLVKSFSRVLAIMVFGVLFMWSAAAKADENLPFEWRVFVDMGGGWSNLSELNEDLDDAGWEEISGGYGSGGLSFIGSYNRWMFGFTTNSANYGETEVKDTDWTATLNSNYGVLQFGYAIIQTKGHQFYPLLGLGGGQSTLTIANSEDEHDFNEALTAPARNSTITAGFLTADLELAYDYRFSFCDYDNGAQASGLVLGARLGYSLSPVSWGHRNITAEVDDGPNMGVNGAYLRFVIGWGGGANYKNKVSSEK